MVAGTLLLVNLLTGNHGLLTQRDPRGASLGRLPWTRRTLPSPPPLRDDFSLHLSEGQPVPENEQQQQREETLMCANLRVKPGVTLEDALLAVSNFCQSFPFAAVLPVQPLHYLPLNETGVEVKFLRKKTDLKSGVDGGIRFFVKAKHDAVEEPEAPPSFVQAEEEDDDNDNEDEDSSFGTSDSSLDETMTSNTIEITARRNSEGQVISKLMSEKLVITKFVAELKDQQLSAFSQTTTRSLQDAVTLTSVFHKWM